MSFARSEPRFPLRIALLCLAALLAVFAVSGGLASASFSQPSTIKYLVTSAGSLALVLVVTARAPLRALVGLAIVVAPLNFVTTIAGMHITPLIAVDMLAVLLWVPRSRIAGRSALRWMAPVFALAMVPGIVGSSAPGVWLVWLAAIVTTGCLTFTVAREPGGATFVVWMVALSGLVQAGLALWELHSHHLLNLYQQGGSVPVGAEYFFTYGKGFRPAGALPDPIGLGQVLALCVPVTVALGARMRRWHASAAVLAAAGVSATALVLSLSRMSMVGGAVGIAVVVALLPKRRILRTAALLAVVVAAVTAVALATNGQTVSRRVSSIFHPTSVHVYTAPGDLTRLRIWRAALKTGEANLVTGVGFGNVAKYLPKYGVPALSSSHSHNSYLQFLAEGGILALLGIVGVIGAAGVDLVRSFKAHRIWVAGAAGALVATLTSWITDVEVRYVQVSAMVAILLGLIAALASRQDGADERTVADPVAEGLASGPVAHSPRGALGGRSEPSAAPGPPRPARAPAFVGDAAGRSPGQISPAPARPGALALVFVSHEDGGAERYVRVVAEGALARGWSVCAAFPPLPATAALHDELVAIGVLCDPLPVSFERAHSAGHAVQLAGAEARATLGWLRRVRPSATLAMLPHPDHSPGIAFANAIHPARSVVSVHAVPAGLSLTPERRALYALCRRLGQRWVAMSMDSRDRLARALRCRADTVEVIYSGMPEAGGAGTVDRRQARREVREELGLDSRAEILITVARLHHQKGYFMIAESIAEVARRHPGAHWVWVGDGPARQSLTSQLRSLGIGDRVTMLGYRRDVDRLLRAADVFILPSRYEAAPTFALLEALAAGLPVIVSAAGPFPEVVRDGVDGLLVPVEDPVTLSAATGWMLEHREQASFMAANGLRRVQSEFSQQRMMDQTLALLSEPAPLAQRLRRPWTSTAVRADSIRESGAA
jgi:glycosyltransferase involved in cell wall biosynthesis